MQLTPSWRKALLLAHIISSLAWLGAIVAYCALAVRGLTGAADLGTRAAYLGMQDIGWHVVVPLGVASVLGGVLQAAGTPWGLLRNYWVVVKLAVSSLALAILLLHIGPTDDLARAAVQDVLQPSDLQGLRLQLVLDSAAAIIVLMVAAALGVYKPAGETPWARPRGADALRAPTGRWLKVLLSVAAIALVSIVIAHLTGHSPHQH